MTNLQSYVLRKIIEQLDPEEQNALNALVQDLGADKPFATFVPSPLIDSEIVSWANSFRNEMAWFLEIGSNELPDFKEFGKRMNIRCNALAHRVKALEEDFDTAKKSLEAQTILFSALHQDCDRLIQEKDKLTQQLDVAANREYEAKATIERLQKELATAKADFDAYKAGAKAVKPEPKKPATTPKPNLLLPWNYVTSPEVMIEYIRLRAAAMTHAMAAMQAGVHAEEREKARTNLQSVVTAAATRGGLDRDVYLDEKLKEWKARRDRTNGK